MAEGSLVGYGRDMYLPQKCGNSVFSVLVGAEDWESFAQTFTHFEVCPKSMPVERAKFDD